MLRFPYGSNALSLHHGVVSLIDLLYWFRKPKTYTRTYFLSMHPISCGSVDEFFHGDSGICICVPSYSQPKAGALKVDNVALPVKDPTLERLGRQQSLPSPVILGLGLEFLAGRVFEWSPSQALIEAVGKIKVGNVFGQRAKSSGSYFYLVNCRL